MPTRFVILLHRLGDGEHWDLMIERGDVLATWQLARNPLTPGPWPIPARRIGNHRKAYLQYEGPLTQNRGSVTRIESGTAKLTEHGPTRHNIQFTGAELAGEFILTRIAHDEWTFDRQQDSPPNA